MKKTYAICMTMIFLALSSCTVESLKFWEEKTSVVPIPFQLTGFDESQKETEEYVEATLKEKFVIEASPEAESSSSDIVLYQARAMENDILKALHSKGYYNAGVEVSVGLEEDEDAQPLFAVKPGELALITGVSIVPKSYEEELSKLDLKAGMPLDAKSVIAAQAALYKSVQEQSCAYDLKVTHQAILDSSMTRAEVVFNITQGKPASFGDLSFTGNETVETSFLDKLAKWEEGACFKKKRLNELRSKMLESGLFSRAEPVTAEDAEHLDTIPVTLNLKERPHRTIKAGLSYYTDEELGISLGWEHRNFFGEGEKLGADLDLSILEQSLETTLDKPYFLREDQKLALNAALKREDTDAYESYSIESGFAINRIFTKKISASVGADLNFSHIKEDDGDSNDYALLSPIASTTYDSRDDTLDPHKGAMVKLSVQPTIDVIGTSDPYVTTQAKARSYYKAHERVVVAGRINMGTIIGASTLDLPASERFYAGGGGSVRGFGYQEIGPFENGNPIGGRSLFETSLELRLKATDKMGVVAFVDAGQVGKDVTPTFDDLSIGAGAGLRYYTDFGPLRFDVGVPLRGDENSDSNFQIYISIGQAF